MRDKDSPGPSEGRIDFFIRTRPFSDAMILAWGYVEDIVSQLFVREFGLEYGPKNHDVRTDFLRRTSFGAKLDVLKKYGRIGDEDFDKIRKFSEKRNALFHGDVYGKELDDWTEAEKNEMLSLASEVSHLVTDIYMRFRKGPRDMIGKRPPNFDNPEDKDNPPKT